MSSKRERRPSMAQRPVLVAIADLIERTGQPAVHADVTDLILQRGERYPQVAQWYAIAEAGAGWVTTDRGTEDNRGGIQSEYRYTMTEAGWASIDREPPGCAWDMSDPSHGPMSCDDERAPGSPYCPRHKAEDAALQAASDDMDQLEAAAGPEAIDRPGERLCGCGARHDEHVDDAPTVGAVKYNPDTDRYEGPDGKEDPGCRARRLVEESSPAAFWGER